MRTGHKETIFPLHAYGKGIAIDVQRHLAVARVKVRLGRVVVLLGFLANADEFLYRLGVGAASLEEIAQVQSALLIFI